LQATQSRQKRKVVIDDSDEEPTSFRGRKEKFVDSSPTAAINSKLRSITMLATYDRLIVGNPKRPRLLIADSDDEDGEEVVSTALFSQRLGRFKKSPIKKGKKQLGKPAFLSS